MPAIPANQPVQAKVLLLALVRINSPYERGFVLATFTVNGSGALNDRTFVACGDCEGESGANFVAGVVCLVLRTPQAWKIDYAHVSQGVPGFHMQSLLAVQALTVCMSHMSCHQDLVCACHKHNHKSNTMVHSSTWTSYKFQQKSGRDAITQL